MLKKLIHHLIFTQRFTWTCTQTHAHTPHSCVQSGLRERAPPSLPLCPNQIVFNWTHGVWDSVSPEISPHSLSFIRTGCFLHASQYCFGLLSDNIIFFFTKLCWIMRRHCLSVDNGNDLFDFSGCVYPVCRYACHRKCCQKTTTKCSKKVSLPYCAPTQQCPMTFILLQWVCIL